MGFISAPGPLELLVILAVALIVLGPARLPEAARSVGRGMRELRESIQGNDDEDDRYRDELDDEEQPAAKPVP
jgi:sec-independent protein translocase protein TatA